MKKVTILLLLTTVLATFTFAQVSVTGGFQAGNVGEGNKGKMDPTLWTHFYGSASKELGPGSIGAELSLGAGLHFAKDFVAYDFGQTDDAYLKGSYTLPAGPGNLGVWLQTVKNDEIAPGPFGDLRFGLDYKGIAAGPATIGFGVQYDLRTLGKDKDAEDAVFADGKDNVSMDRFAAKLSLGFDFGLSISYSFRYGLVKVGDEDKSDIDRIVYLNIGYQVIDPLTVGLEVDGTGKEFKGFTLKPYGDYSITDNTTLGIFITLEKINNDVEGEKDILITPGLTISHSF